MKIRALVMTGIVAILLTVVPVVFAQIAAREDRQLQGVRLQDTRYEDVVFYNRDQGLRLTGMLFRPEGAGPFPAVVIIHGSGTSHRDNPWYLMLAQYLQHHGILVLLPDKRGSEMSEGDWRGASFEDLATDTVAAVDYLKGQGNTAISQVGIIGASQGGQLSPLVANQSPDVSFLVNLVGAAVPLYDQLLYEENHNLRKIGLLPGISNLAAYPATWSIREVRQTEFWDAVGNFDPLPYWQQLRVPALVIYGKDDTNVPSLESAAVLRSLNRDNIHITIYSGSGHGLEDPEGQGSHIIRSEALREITTFILEKSNQS